MQHEEHTRTEEENIGVSENSYSSVAKQERVVSSVSAHTPTSSGTLAIVGVLLLILVLALGGAYVWVGNNTPTDIPYTSDETESIDPVVDLLHTYSGSDELSSIEYDLDTTDFSAINADIESLEAELQVRE